MKTFAPLTDLRHKAVLAAAVGAVATLAAACGSQTSQGSQGSPYHPGAAAKPASSLTISVAAAQGATPHDWTLTCDPAGGTHPDPQRACAVLSNLKDPFAPVRAGVMCPMIVSGPQTASITGTWEGKKVAAKFSRADGCQTQRWNQLVKVLGQVNPGGPMIPASTGSG